MTTKIHVKLQSCTPSNAAFLLGKLKEDFNLRREAKTKEILDEYNSHGWIYKLLFEPSWDNLTWLYYDSALRDFLRQLTKIDKSTIELHELEVDIALWNRYTSFHREHLGDVKILEGE